MKGRKECGKENSGNEEEAFLAKINDKTKGNLKKKGDNDPKRKRLVYVITVRKKGTLKPIAGRKIHQSCLSSIGRRRMLRLGK